MKSIKLYLLFILAVLHRSVNEFTEPHLRVIFPAGNAASVEEMSQRAVGNTMSDLIGPRFAPQTSRSRDARVYRSTNY